MKTCRKCLAEKDASAFNRYKNAPDGLQYWCRECSSENNKARHRDPAVVKKAWYKGTEEQRARARAARAATRAADPEAERARCRAARKANPERLRGYERNRYNMKRANSGWVSSRQWEAIKCRHGWLCYYCGEAKPLTMDHHTALSRGGAHEPDNVVPACQACNSRKTYLSSEEFAERMLRDGERARYSQSVIESGNVKGREAL